MAEDLAIWCALLHVSSLNFKFIWLRSDSQGLITAINSTRRSIELFGILSDVALLISSSFLSVSVSFVYRNLDGPADALAKDKDDRISLLETQMTAQHAGYEAQRRLNQQIMEMMQRMYPNEVFPDVPDP
ncbi:hypothetical protein F2Q69_00046165 [Brassica cretica]|uniref:RNase H type-1 domain-containing protein n=1 Tax=Brassica cretica TaxID=69181 RepID=A0A8S9PPM3_BRACR|nr:hypothetical protein F2Q69_00046165 [Brassica cretica]